MVHHTSGSVWLHQTWIHQVYWNTPSKRSLKAYRSCLLWQCLTEVCIPHVWTCGRGRVPSLDLQVVVSQIKSHIYRYNYICSLLRFFTLFVYSNKCKLVIQCCQDKAFTHLCIYLIYFLLKRCWWQAWMCGSGVAQAEDFTFLYNESQENPGASCDEFALRWKKRSALCCETWRITERFVQPCLFAVICSSWSSRQVLSCVHRQGVGRTISRNFSTCGNLEISY